MQYETTDRDAIERHAIVILDVRENEILTEKSDDAHLSMLLEHSLDQVNPGRYALVRIPD